MDYIAQRGTVGIAPYSLHRNTNQVALVCYLQDLFRRLEVRGQAIGGKQIEALCAAARASSYVREYCQTHGNDAPPGVSMTIGTAERSS